MEITENNQMQSFNGKYQNNEFPYEKKCTSKKVSPYLEKLRSVDSTLLATCSCKTQEVFDWDQTEVTNHA